MTAPSQYATLDQLYAWGAPLSAFGSSTTDARLGALRAASGELDAAISSQGSVPLLAWPDDIAQKVCHIAAYEIMAQVGFNPAAGSDQNFVMRMQAARMYFRDIAKGIIRPLVTFSTPRADGAQPTVRSKPARGW